MSAPAHLLENAVESPTGHFGFQALAPLSVHNSVSSPVSATSPASPTFDNSKALTTTQNATGNSNQALTTTSAGHVGSSNASNYGYGSSMGYGGMGSMYGGLGGMGGMYGGLGGMGGMYGGLGGMGGMYGGLGGMYGGMGGMYGGMGGMPEDVQRSQMTFMLVSRLMEMCGMVAGVLQMTFGSSLQFMSNYIGMSQQYNQLQSGMYMDATGNWVQAPQRKSKRVTAHVKASQHRKGGQQRNEPRRWVSILRRIAFLLLAIFMVRRLTARSTQKQLYSSYQHFAS